MTNKAKADSSNCSPANKNENGCSTICCTLDLTKPKPLTSSQTAEDNTQTEIRIMQMDCPVEEALIRKKLTENTSVKALDFNLMQRILIVTHTPDSLDAILAAIRCLGFEPELTNKHSSPVSEKKTKWLPLIVAGIAAISAEISHWSNLSEWFVAGFAILAVASCGLTTYKKGWISIRSLNLNINALMSIAVSGALFLGQWSEGAMVMVLFTIAELIEAKSLGKARNAINSLLSLTPDTVSVQQPDGSWSLVDANTVTLGCTVRAKPGERIGLDGVIIKGRTSINQAPITGESLPVDKTIGDQVFAGTINEVGGFDYRVTAMANNTTLARIIHAVENAQSKKAPTQRFIDRFAQVYTPTVLLIAIVISILPPLLDYGDWKEWLYKALTMLIIACPCALVISTPVTIVSGLTAATRKGILIKGGVYLEQGRKLSTLILDKTGTLTHGKPQQTETITFKNNKEEIVSYAASLADYSDHPVSQAISKAAINHLRHNVDDFTALAGRGVHGVISEKPYYLGNLRLVEEYLHLDLNLSIKENIQHLEKQGKTVVLLSDDKEILGLFTVTDTLKQSSPQAIKQLHDLNIKTIMLTGDNQYTADTIAAQTSIDQASGNQLPEDKLKAVQEYSQQGVTGMVGDGINDAPALAFADIGFAMGAMGTDTAIETADVALMDDDLQKIPAFIRLSKQTYSILIQNITFALVTKVIFLLLTVAGISTMWMAVFADVGTSLLVIANGLRLLRK